MFWAGQLLLYGAAACGAARRAASDLGRLAVLGALGAGTFFLKVAYSPLHFSFPDEFQHVRSLADVLRTDHLFHANPSLPVSPTFPGLEIATDALVTTTGLSRFVAGLVVAGIAHVLVVSALFLVFREIFSGIVSGLATVVFATEPHFEYFDAIFGYQTLALPLAALGLLAALKLMKRHRPWRLLSWWTVGVLSAFALVVTHHVTTFAFLAILILIAAFAAVRGHLQPALYALVCMAATGVWIWRVARGTLTYLGNPIIDSLLYIFPGRSSSLQTHGSAAPAPLSDRVIAYAAVLVTLYLIALGWRRLWRLESVRAAELALAVGAVSYPCVLFVRAFAGDSAELAGRLLTFALLPVAAVTAPVLVRRWLAPRWRSRLPALAAVLLLAAGGVVIGWPPWWERLPGPFRVASFERGVDAQDLDAAVWAAGHLRGPGRIGGDFVAESLMGTYGRQPVAHDVSSLFYAPRFRHSDAVAARAQSLRYLVVDTRMTSQLPASGGYFSENPPGPVRRVPRSSLSKFDRIHGVDRLYDSGPLVIYDLLRSPYLGS